MKKDLRKAFNRVWEMKTKIILFLISFHYIALRYKLPLGSIYQGRHLVASHTLCPLQVQKHSLVCGLKLLILADIL